MPSHHEEGATQGEGVFAKCEVMGFCLKFGHFEKGGGLPLFRATEIFQNASWGATLDVQKCIFVHFLGMQKEIGGVFCHKSDGSLHAYLGGMRWP